MFAYLLTVLLAICQSLRLLVVYLLNFWVKMRLAFNRHLTLVTHVIRKKLQLINQCFDLCLLIFIFWVGGFWALMIWWFLIPHFFFLLILEVFVVNYARAFWSIFCFIFYAPLLWFTLAFNLEVSVQTLLDEHAWDKFLSMQVSLLL